MSVRHPPLLGMAAAAMLVTTGAVPAPTKVVPAPTIQDLMDQVVDPAADGLWGSVGLIETGKGVEHRAPRSPADWRRAGQLGRQLADGAAALQQPRPVGRNGGGGLADARTPGIRTAEQIGQAIRANRAKFRSHAERLRAAAQDAVAAADAHDVERLLRAGAAIDAACESCHAAYWYPTARLALPSREAFAGYRWDARKDP